MSDKATYQKATADADAAFALAADLDQQAVAALTAAHVAADQVGIVARAWQEADRVGLLVDMRRHADEAARADQEAADAVAAEQAALDAAVEAELKGGANG